MLCLVKQAFLGLGREVKKILLDLFIQCKAKP